MSPFLRIYFWVLVSVCMPTAIQAKFLSICTHAFRKPKPSGNLIHVPRNIHLQTPLKMTLPDRLNRIECLDQLIRQRRTGFARKLAEHPGIHERTVFEELDLMRSMGAEIKWRSQRRSYYYANSGQFRFGWFLERESRE
jgi:hypothetical protein